jgi:hypothetical protein
MKENVLWTTASLLSVLFFTLHLAGDIVRGIEKGDISNFPAIPMAVLWLSATLLLAERRSGYIIVLLFSILGAGIPVVHMMGKGMGLGTRLAKYSGHFSFVWTLLALGVTALFTLILSVRGLWSLRRARGRASA